MGFKNRKEVIIFIDEHAKLMYTEVNGELLYYNNKGALIQDLIF